MASQQQQDRAAVEHLKRQNAELQELLVHKRAQQASCSQETGTSSGASWLEAQIAIFKAKAEQEEQLARQLQTELETIKQQLQLAGHSGNKQPARCDKHSLGSSDSKQLVVLQERLSHQKQRLDKLNASDASQQQALQNLAKCTHAARLAAQQLQRQLSSTQAETAAVHQLLAAVEAAQHKAAHLSQLLLSQDDAEHLAVSALAKQVTELQLLHQQHSKHLDTPAEAAPATDHTSCHSEAYTEEEAQAVLEQLARLLDDAGLPCRTGQVAEDSANPEDPSNSDAPADRQGMHAGLLRRLQQLESDNYSLFVKCMVADWSQQQQQLAALTSGQQ